MQISIRLTHIKAISHICIGALLAQAATQSYAASTDIANVPMAVSNMVTPNVLVIYDNSQSMDAYMNGTLVSGNDPTTRGNIGRSVMRNAIGTYRTTFNWGLMTYGMSGLSLQNTHAYFMGDTAGMNFTNDCKDTSGNSISTITVIPPTIGISASKGNRRCIVNPQPAFGANYITYDVSGDDPDILDVLYSGTALTTNIWALSSAANSSNYNLWFNRIGNGWTAGDFNNFWFNGSFTPTDAGYLPFSPTVTRQVYIPRGWGYTANISGSGNLNEAVKPDSTTHYNTLQSLLGNETNGATGEVKNGALFTPLRGSLKSAKTYFSTSFGGNTSPVQYTCQQNFVMMVTDGKPTGDTAGNLYSASDRTNTCTWSTTTNSCTTGSFGTAATDAITAANALRTTPVTGFSSTKADGSGAITGKYDVQTYIVALGDTVANADALSVMNAMAYNGGTDKAIPANNATAFQNAITAISDDITAKVSSGAAVAVANAHVTSTDNASYASSYNSGTWTGDLNSNSIDVTTGAPTASSPWTAGSAATQLDLRTSASRFIVTSIDTAGAIGGVQFQPTSAATSTKLSAGQQSLLNSASLTDGAAVLAYLRGDRSGEPATYRPRAHLLGDIINGEPVLVREPSAGYADTGYSAFATSNASRTRMLYQGANDGMLHAFVATTGAEAWAYVPNSVMANLNNLSQKTGFSHKYYVDGTPVAGDVDFYNIDGVTSGGDWRTILVGGLGKGGRGFYALDITAPVAANETAVASKVLWEFPNSISNATTRATATQNIGYSYAKPVILKTTAKGWVALVTSGYNNGTNVGDSGGDGLGHLYVINPKTGELIKDISTPACAATPATSPCGLAQISASIDANNAVDYVYGGDLNGNIWRFDLTGTSSGSWSAAKFATLKDSTGATQPITTAPRLTFNSGVRMVLVGTGLYLGNTDIPGVSGANSSSSQTQTMYGLKDTLLALPTALRSSLQQQTITTSGLTRAFSNNTVDYTIKNGWYVDLPTTGERVTTQPAVYLNTLVFTSNIPSSTKCDPGGSSWLYQLNTTTGSLAQYAAGTVSGLYLGKVLASAPIVFQLPNGKYVTIVHTTGLATPPSSGFGDGTTTSACNVGSGCETSVGLASPPVPTFTPVKRTWRQIYPYQ
jgi:type IV pilus assembly protein PilY1